MTELVLEARLDRSWNRAGIDLARATETDLRCRSLLGDVEFRVGDADFSTQWGWIPLLDFALGLTGLLTRLPRSNNEVFEFTESGAELRFELIHGEVEVRSNFAASIGRTPLDALREAVRRLGDEVLHVARQEAPGIDANPDFRRLASDLSNP